MSILGGLMTRVASEETEKQLVKDFWEAVDEQPPNLENTTGAFVCPIYDDKRKCVGCIQYVDCAVAHR